MKKILIFSNQEQIGDGIIKLPFIYEVKLRFPDYVFFWATNSGETVYNSSLKSMEPSLFLSMARAKCSALPVSPSDCKNCIH